MAKDANLDIGQCLTAVVEPTTSLGVVLSNECIMLRLGHQLATGFYEACCVSGVLWQNSQQRIRGLVDPVV